VRLFAHIIFLLSATLLLSGCRKSEDKTAGRPAAEKPKIALVMKSLANEFFSTMAAGASRHQK
jgi:ribose transport system substrate-binding protein